MARLTPLYNSDEIEQNAVVRLWLLRILVPLRGHRAFLRPHGFDTDALAEAIGLSHWIDPVDREFEPKAVLSELTALHKVAEKKWATASIPERLRTNVHQLSGLLDLCSTDCRILEFAVMVHNERVLDDAGDTLGQLSSTMVSRVIAGILDLPAAQVQASLSVHGVLARSGLVSLDRNGANTLCCKLDLLSNAFADLMASSESDPVNLLRGVVATVSASELSLADYDHISPSLDILRPYLRRAIQTRRRGVNIFLHGAPGTGKSQLARVLAQDLGTELFEVSSEDSDGDAVKGERRLRALRAAQSFFPKRHALIAFDEAEDVFDDGDQMFGRRSTAQVRKSWTNRMLEDNPVPTLWISNSIDGLDQAFIRRFDMVLELPVPPRSQRERILHATCEDILDDESIYRFAEAESLAPAIVARASSVIRTIQEDIGQDCCAPAFERLINNTMEAQGHRPIIQNDPNQLPSIYDPAFVQADTQLDKLTCGLSGAQAGRLLLYGPPGTGKTAYGRWLARQLDAPLVTKRASDMVSKWVGESEKNIAQTFRQAQQEGALLLIDEVDSFLQDRRGAHRGWEVTMVNEMLTQMESFSGVFIASTNLMSGLDQAALRRFDLKVKFDFLRPYQAWQMMCRSCEQLQLGAPPAELEARIARLNCLTPGDFSAVMRRHRFHVIESPELLVQALENECAMKNHAKAQIGFV